jgi:hypothetical protein
LANAPLPLAWLRFSFASLEAAFIRTYGIAPADQARFRARLTFLQRGGLFGARNRPGKGTRLGYDIDMMRRVLFCVELAELGIAPSEQLKLVAELWDKRICEIFNEAETANRHGGDDIVLLMTGVSLMVEAAWGGAVPNINSTTLSKLPAKMALAMRPRSKDDPLLPRLLAVNLSARLRRFHDALADVHLKFEQPPIQAQTAPRASRRKRKGK